ncbi:winged helix-turn-helix transcriptional regulator [Chlorobium ferrooxidans]|uniref:winged helix-turn-helix transcriptional regulator n=1 Tax=Chlorobium ferrooxidans TaxID=84205 RepID=UPI00058C2470|nr:winged helix-turn-helix transcriptional regulator [Chlorobium ferrooxidans]
MQENQHIEWKKSWRDEYLKWIFVANTFFRAGMIEACGRGIERIMQECTAAGVSAPKLRYEQTGLWTVFHFLAEHVLGGDAGETSLITTPEKILALLRAQSSISSREIAASIGLNRDGVKYYLGKMISNGVIRHIGPSRGGHRVVLQ